METSNPFPVLVVGAGNIGSAMARGIAAGGQKVVLYNRTPRRLEAFAGIHGIECTSDFNQALKSDPWLALICVETDAVASFVAALARQAEETDMIIGSCAAVPTLADMKNALGAFAGTPRLLRVLPNIAATCGKSVNLMAQEGLSECELQRVRAALAPTGELFDVPERLFGAAMSLSSCGIAFALRYVRAQTEAAVALGMTPALATAVAAATLGGVSAMLASGEHPEVLVDRVTTPGGLTIRGLNAMEDAGFSAAVMAGVKSAVR